MDASSRRKRSAPKPGLRAIEACGDGFWELDLNSGSAWYSAWFYQKLGWSTETRRTTLGELEPVMTPGSWTKFLARMRAHLEQGQPLEVDVEVKLAPATVSTWWHIRGSALRNAAGQPVHLAGSMREVGAERGQTGAEPDPLDAEPGKDGANPGEAGTPAVLLGVRSAFDALPVAAALLDARAALIEANREWRAFPVATTTQAIARLKAANSQTGLEFWLDQEEEFDAGPRRLRVRAIAFQHEGARHLAVTLEDRRSD